MSDVTSVTGDSALGNTEEGRVNKPAKTWVFTLNNYTEQEYTQIKSLVGVSKGIVGKEVGENGTPHLQGTITFKKAYRLTALKKLLPRAHWEACKAVDASWNYCMKDGSWEKLGNQVTVTTRVIVDDLKKISFGDLTEKSKKLVEAINELPDDFRTINWIYDAVGNSGKTLISKYYNDNYEDVLVVCGKGDRIKHSITSYCESTRRSPKLIIWDLPRDTKHISYTGLEEVKNGLFFNTRYEAKIVRYNPPKIVVFANFLPDECALSSDRWNIIYLQDKKAKVDHFNI